MQDARVKVMDGDRTSSMRVLGFTFFIVVADQVSKLLVKGFTIPFLGIAVRGYPYGSSRPLLGDFVRLTYIENPGMAFGIDLGWKFFFSLFSILASLGILFYLYKARNEPFLFRLSLALILGGAIGNLIDRVLYGVMFNEGTLFHGRVVDFIDVDFFNVSMFGYHLSRWPVFNIADAAVTCGVLLMLFSHRKKDAIAVDPGMVPLDPAPSIPPRPATTPTEDTSLQ